MRIQGLKKTCKVVTVDITLEDLKKAVLQLFKKQNPSYKSLSYLERNKDGYLLYEYEYTHPHNDDDVYSNREPTPEEVEMYLFVAQVKSLFNTTKET